MLNFTRPHKQKGGPTSRVYTPKWNLNAAIVPAMKQQLGKSQHMLKSVNESRKPTRDSEQILKAALPQRTSRHSKTLKPAHWSDWHSLSMCIEVHLELPHNLYLMRLQEYHCCNTISVQRNRFLRILHIILAITAPTRSTFSNTNTHFLSIKIVIKYDLQLKYPNLTKQVVY